MKPITLLLAVMFALPALAQQSPADKVTQNHNLFGPALQTLAGCSDDSWKLILRFLDADALKEKMPPSTDQQSLADINLVSECTIQATANQKRYFELALDAIKDGDSPSLSQYVGSAAYLSIVIDEATSTQHRIYENYLRAKSETLVEEYNTLVDRYNLQRSSNTPVVSPLHCISRAMPWGTTMMDCQ